MEVTYCRWHESMQDQTGYQERIQSSGGNTSGILREYSLMIFDGILAYPNQTELLLEPLARIIHECRRKAAETKVM